MSRKHEKVWSRGTLRGTLCPNRSLHLQYCLVERGSWPPGGSDLSYYLRTVIVDSLESLVKLTDGQFLKSSEGRHRIFMEAEYRHGLAIHDLRASSSRERWLNPSCEYPTLVLGMIGRISEPFSEIGTDVFLRAPDFLLIDYKPPPPLDVVITPEVLSKYQHIFSFILHLVRGKKSQ